MPQNFANTDLLVKIVEEIGGDENRKRKDTSFAEFEIFQDKLLNYVKNYLQCMYSKDTLKEMPMIACVNLARRIVIQEASIYKECPKRKWTGLTDEQVKVVEQIYADMNIDAKLLKSNQYFKLQHQNHLQVVPKNGKLMMRVLLNHHLDVVPSRENPEDADAYIINGYNRQMSRVSRDPQSDSINETIADNDDAQGTLKRFALWSKEENFIFDEKGNILSPDTKNELGIAPFVDISPDKDFEYWIRIGQAVTDFTIQFNGALSDLGHIVRMQGFAQAWMKGPAELVAQNIQIGPSFVIKLTTSASNAAETDFGFASPNPDLAGSIQYIEMLLSNFLSSRGLDPKIISGSGEAEKYASGIERLLAMLEKFDASRSDLAIYQDAEQKIWEIVKTYINVYGRSPDVLNYNIASIPEDATMTVVFEKPEMMQSEKEELEGIQLKMDLQLMSHVQALMEVHDITKDEAIKLAKEIEQDNSMVTLAMPKKNDPNAPVDPNAPPADPNQNPVDKNQKVVPPAKG